MSFEITPIEVDQQFNICPNCGYEDGFHSMFQRSAEADEFHWYFICPNCHAVFDIGLRAPFTATN